jgi:hypothetical protein
VHSKPYSPEGRGKQERLNRYIREAFLAEAAHRGIESRRHVHRAVPQAARPDPDPTGIDYLGLVAAAHEEAAGTGAKIDFTALGRLTGGHPGQQHDHDREPEEPR